jgi:hypothetical protein
MGPGHRTGVALREIAQSVPQTPFIACTTAGEFTEQGVTEDGLVVFLVSGGDELMAASSLHQGLKLPESVARQCAAAFHEQEVIARKRGFASATTLTLIDGLVPTGEAFTKSLLQQTRPFHMIAGGAAGDLGRFVATEVAADGHAVREGAAALHIFSKSNWGVGIKHGLTATPKCMKVTRIEGATLKELDGAPAFEAYRAHAAERGIEITPQTASSYMIQNQMGVLFLKEVAHARTALGASSDGSLGMAGSIAQGATVCFLNAEPDSVIRALRDAARQAIAALKGAKPAGLLVFDCICRKLILGERLKEEVDVLRQEFGDIPVAGFLTYGEIARASGQLSAWHNATCVVLAIPE